MVINVSHPQPATGFTVQLVGKSCCNFGKKGKKENIAKPLREGHFTEAHKKGEAQIHDAEVVLVKPPQPPPQPSEGGKPVFNISTGVYPFNFKLPVKLPSSFKGTYGSITYELIAKLHPPPPTASVDGNGGGKAPVAEGETEDAAAIAAATAAAPVVEPYTANVPVTVYEVIESNRTLYKNGFTGNGYKAYGLNCFNLNCIAVTGRVDRACYLPGDMMYIDARVNNMSDRKVKALKAKLLKKITYHYKKRTLVEEMVVAKVVSKDMQWDRKPLAVPDISPNVVSELINVKHVLRLQVNGITAEIPVVIGSVPYKATSSADVDATTSKSPLNGTTSKASSTLTLPKDFRTSGKGGAKGASDSSDTDAPDASSIAITRSVSH